MVARYKKLKLKHLTKFSAELCFFHSPILLLLMALYDRCFKELDYICGCKVLLMLTEEEKAFLEYWEQNRIKERKAWRQLLIGLPLGLIFALPILINLFSGWYIRADMEARTQSSPTVLIVAAIIIASFFAIFSKRYQWERSEQRYKELKEKENK